MSETSGLYCYSGYKPSDKHYTSMDVQKTQIMRGRLACNSSTNVKTLQLRTTQLTAQNVVVNNSLSLENSGIYGIYSFSSGDAYNILTVNWELLPAASVPFTTEVSQNITFTTPVATVSANGFYVVTLNDTIATSAITALGWSVNGADPTFTFVSIPITGGSTINESTILYLNAGDTVQLAVKGSIAGIVIFSQTTMSLASRGF
jgi:hypothetical protein